MKMSEEALALYKKRSEAISELLEKHPYLRREIKRTLKVKR